jgi:hypothetical protein
MMLFSIIAADDDWTIYVIIFWSREKNDPRKKYSVHKYCTLGYKVLNSVLFCDTFVL